MKTDFLKKRGIKFEYNDKVQKLINASGDEMKCAGEIVLYLFANDRICPVNALISDDSIHDLIISWHDLITLDSIPPTFPYAAKKNERIHDYDFCDPAAMRVVDTTQSESLMNEMKKKYASVVKNEISQAPMQAEPLKIFLTEDAQPRRCLTVRQTPIHMQEEADQLVENLLKSGIIVKVNDNEPTPWVSPGFFVPKPSGKGVRLVTDYRELNKYIKRPIHPFPSARDCLKKIPHSARVFCKLDCLHGYFQLALDPQSSYLTTFLLPSGRYRYVRAPMGMSASSDGFCYASDAMLEGLQFAVKIVDDILIWADNYEQLRKRVEEVLRRCQKYHVTVSERKMEIGEEISFAGYIVSSKGFKPDPRQVDGIRKLPSPTNLTELRSLLGLANQLGWFIPDLVHATSKMRELLKKDTVFMWQDEHEKELNVLKFILTSPMVVQPFVPGRQTFLLTDASRTRGLGYALMQKDEEGKKYLVNCGSTTLTSAQKNYSTIELEALGILYAIDKCSFYLIRMPHFEVWSDHRPLEGVFKKDMDATMNHRLATIREKLASFNFTVHHIPGKKNVIADALSRAPMFDPAWHAATTCAATTEVDPALQFLFDSAVLDTNYQKVLMALQSDKKMQELSDKHPAKQFKAMWDQISIYEEGGQQLLLVDGNRIIVPQEARQEILKRLHLAHTGMNKTKALARQHFYWPGMNNDVENAVKNCQMCFSRLPAQASVPNDPTNVDGLEPMMQVGMDLFHYGNRDYLIVVDRLSGYPFPMPITSQGTETVVKKLKYLFDNYGYPKQIRSDGGPCFASMAFSEFCKKFSIKHEISSAYNPTSNGLAEAGVKNMKSLIAKCKEAKEDFDSALLEWRTTPKEDGPAPANVFFKRQLRTQLPRVLVGEADDKMHQQRQQQFNNAAERFHDTSRPLPPLNVGQRVAIQDSHSGQWTEQGTVEVVREGGLSYHVKTKAGKLLIRNRKFLRPVPGEEREESGEEEIRAQTPQQQLSTPRRSARIAQHSRSLDVTEVTCILPPSSSE